MEDTITGALEELMQAGCLPPLMPALTDKAPEITADLLKMLLKSPKFADRKGAAFGLAGAVKGLGMSAFWTLFLYLAASTAASKACLSVSANLS